MVLDFFVIGIFLLAIIVGYRIGFLTYVMKIASIFTGIIVSFVLITPVHTFAMDSSLGQKEINSFVIEIENSLHLKEDETAVDEFLVELGLPSLIATVVASMISSDATGDELTIALATNLASITMWIKCFIILLVSITILTMFIKIFIKKIRTIKSVRIIDGLAGILISCVISILFGFVIITTIEFLADIGIISSFGIYMDQQYNQSFGLYSWYYDHNFIHNFLNLLF
ncbi:MAG: hypothetical protein R3Y60_01255 [bacterium]